MNNKAAVMFLALGMLSGCAYATKTARQQAYGVAHSLIEEAKTKSCSEISNYLDGKDAEVKRLLGL